MQLSYERDGRTYGFECSDNWVSRYTSEGILRGETYPALPFVEGIEVILDIGANCGAAAVFLSTLYPHATVLAFEPATVPYGLLERNTAHLPGVRAHKVGLHATDGSAELHHGALDSATASILRRDGTSDSSEVIELRSASGWLDEHSIERVDLIKIDTEGCEVPVLTSLRDRLPTVKIVYLEFHSETDRRVLDELLGDTHVLVYGKMLLNIGEAAYVARSAFPGADPTSPEVGEWLRDVVKREIHSRAEGGRAAEV